jgi:hypothetical protein
MENDLKLSPKVYCEDKNLPFAVTKISSPNFNYWENNFWIFDKEDNSYYVIGVFYGKDEPVFEYFISNQSAENLGNLSSRIMSDLSTT